jgi:hypothetical protein
MPGALDRRLGALEAAAAGCVVAERVVYMPHEAWDLPDDEARAVTAAAIAEHRRRTGYLGPVLVAPMECASAEEWEARYARRAGGAR